MQPLPASEGVHGIRPEIASSADERETGIAQRLIAPFKWFERARRVSDQPTNNGAADEQAPVDAPRRACSRSV